MEFSKIIRDVKRDETIRWIQESDQLIYDTIHKNAEAVAAQIEKSMLRNHRFITTMNRRCAA